MPKINLSKQICYAIELRQIWDQEVLILYCSNVLNKFNLKSDFGAQTYLIYLKIEVTKSGQVP